MRFLNKWGNCFPGGCSWSKIVPKYLKCVTPQLTSKAQFFSLGDIKVNEAIINPCHKTVKELGVAWARLALQASNQCHIVHIFATLVIKKINNKVSSGTQPVVRDVDREVRMGGLQRWSGVGGGVGWPDITSFRISSGERGEGVG